MIQSRPKYWMRPTALLLAASLMAPTLAGCGGHQNDNVPPPVDNSGPGRMTGGPTNSPPKTGMSTGKKVVIALAGAALLYWLWKHHQQQNGQNVQYFKSKKNGRIYYRDPKTHQAHWVTPAPSYEVTPEEQQQLQKFQGYNNQNTGEDYTPPASDSGPGP
jgi:hypothetical protein